MNFRVIWSLILYYFGLSNLLIARRILAILNVYILLAYNLHISLLIGLLYNASALLLSTLLTYKACAVNYLLSTKLALAEDRSIFKICQLKFEVITIFYCIVKFYKFISYFRRLSFTLKRLIPF